MLENRLIRGAFTTERLDAVKLIAGQLAVSLDNAQLYAEFRRIADEQAALRRVATLVARAAPPAEVFAAVTAEVGRLLDADHASLVRYDPDGEVTVVAAWTGTGAAAPDPRRHPGQPRRAERDHAGVPARPARAARRLRGHLAAPSPNSPARPGVRASVGSAGQRRGPAVGRRHDCVLQPARSRCRRTPRRGWPDSPSWSRPPSPTPRPGPQLTASRARIVATADATRRRIERDLHDGAQQRLVSLALRLRAARATVPPDLGELATRSWTAIGARLNGALDEVGEIARGIHPAALAKGGLRAALRALARRSPIPVDLDLRVEGAAARACRGQRVLRRGRGADQRGQARARLGRQRRGGGRR